MKNDRYCSFGIGSPEPALAASDARVAGPHRPGSPPIKLCARAVVVGYRAATAHFEQTVAAARAAIDAGDWDLAAETMTELVARRPELKNSYKIAQLYIVANTHDFQPFNDWVDQRNEGHTPDFTQMVSVHK